MGKKKLENQRALFRKTLANYLSCSVMLHHWLYDSIYMFSGSIPNAKDVHNVDSFRSDTELFRFCGAHLLQQLEHDLRELESLLYNQKLREGPVSTLFDDALGSFCYDFCMDTSMGLNTRDLRYYAECAIKEEHPELITD